MDGAVQLGALDIQPDTAQHLGIHLGLKVDGLAGQALQLGCLLYTSCNLIREKYGLKQGEYILYVGRISPEKGTMDLVAVSYTHLDVYKRQDITKTYLEN